MQRVVVLFIGILSVVRVTPFDLDRVDQPTPFWTFWHTFRVENDGFGNPDDSEHQNDYKFVSFESGENSNPIDEAGKGKSTKGLSDLFGNLKECDVVSFDDEDEGCFYATNGDIMLLGVLSTVDVEDVDAAFEEAGIEECEVLEDGTKNVPKGGCFLILEKKKTVFLLGVFDEEVIYEEDKIVEGIKNLFNTVVKCDLSTIDDTQEGCVMFDEKGIHYIRVLNNVTRDEFETNMNKLDIPECIYDESIGVGLATKEPCYLMFYPYYLHFFNLHGRFTITQDGDDDDEQHFSEETYGIPDLDVQRSPSLVQTATRSEKLHLLKLGEKGLFNQRSSVDKKAKDLPPKKTDNMAVKTLDNNVGNVNHRPKWMKYFQTNL